MHRTVCPSELLNVLLSGLFLTIGSAWATDVQPDVGQQISLPRPSSEGSVSVERALRARRSVRDFTTQPVALEAVSQILWAAQGKSFSGRRTAPSAGALYPLEVYLVVGDITDLAAGVYKYQPRTHALSVHALGDARQGLARAALWQGWIADGAAVLVIAAVYERTARKYGSRAERYVHIEVGHVAQNVYLQVQSLGLGTTIVGAFRDRRVSEVLDLPADEAPLALMPVGRPK